MKNLSDAELCTMLSEAQQHNPNSGFMRDAEAALSLRAELNRRRQERKEAITHADELLARVGLSSYTELGAVLNDLNDNSWLDENPCDTEDLAAAKIRALNAYVGSGTNALGLHV